LKILIIGCKGFIGSNLVKYFSEKGYAVTGADIMDELGSATYTYLQYTPLAGEWQAIFNKQSFDFCINAAGSGNVAYSVTNPLADFEANTYDVIKILDAIRKYQFGCKYLHISSAAVYGNPMQLPICETDALNPISPYGFHKLVSEHICREFHQLYGLPVTVIRPFSVYGAGLQKQLLWDICKKIYQTPGKSISLYGTGKESRDFIYIDDLAALIEILIKSSPFKNDVFNAASGAETCIAEIAIEIKNWLPQTQIHFSGEVREADPINWCANIDKITAIGFKPVVNLQDGIKKYVDWFKMLHYDDK
jgi:dTDP-glucose 4,6-dehydratase/UDP-glucose 4-epimerase